jgi:oxygen-independent coproporphyrinogen-3 oxidase
MVSCGVSAISAVGGTYSQNEKSLERYYEHIERGQLPIARGFKLDMDDVLRRIVIQVLMCNFELSMKAIELTHPITFATYFEKELLKLRELAADGLLTMTDDWITVTPKGRLLIRNICMVFDKYLGQGREIKLQRMRYSKTI